MKKLLGRTDIEDAFKKLDKLTHVEALVATAQYAHCRMQSDWD